MSTVLVSIFTAIGAFSVSGLSIFLGYKLFVAGATGQFQFNAKHGESSVGLKNAAPGLAFAISGACIAIYAIRNLMGG